MPAQNGASVVLSYGTQGDQQLGDDVLLAYGSVISTRSVAASLHARWAKAEPAEIVVQARHERPVMYDQDVLAPWTKGNPVERESQAGWGVSQRRDQDAKTSWGRYERRADREAQTPWGVSVRRDHEQHAPWGRYERRADREVSTPWRGSAKRDTDRQVPWRGPMVVVDTGLSAAFTPSKPADLTQYVPWTRYSRTLDPGWGIPTPPNPLPEPGEPVIIPVRRIYVVQNEVLLIRVSTMDTVPCESMSLSLDVDSWTWSFSASIRGQFLEMVEPEGSDPVELEVIVNGVQFRVYAEKLGRERRFGDTTIRVSGRGKAAVLDSPYAPILTFSSSESRTAQQLANEALQLNGVPIGWDINWNLASDWTVPAGAWNHTGTHISALARIAEAAGAFLRPDPVLQEISFIERYPTMPDTWAAMTSVDYELPASLTEREGIEWLDQPNYNAVYISGQGQGYLSYVKKTGSAGDLFAPMVTDALNTDNNSVARMRGRSILAQTGRKAMVTLNVPVLEALGVVEPGKFVKYVDGGVERVGIVRSTQVDVTYPNVWQSLSIETHVEVTP